MDNVIEQAKEVLKEYEGHAPASYVQRMLKISIGQAIDIVREIQREQARQTLFQFIGTSKEHMAQYLVYYNEDKNNFVCTLDRKEFETEFAAVSYTKEKLEEYV